MESEKGCAIVTGAAGNIGGGVTRRLAKDGFPVIMFDVDQAKLDTLVRDIEGAGATAVGKVVDVCKRAEVDAAVAEALKRFGRIDALICVVGHSGFKRVNDIAEIDDDIWDGLIELNLKSAFICNRAVVPIMQRQKYGRIVNFSSAGHAGHRGPVSGSRLPYYTAKAAVITMTKQIAMDVAPDGVTANVISPGLIVGAPGTRIRQMWESHMTPQQIETVFQSLGPKRPGEPEEIGAAVSFLVSPGASYVSGQNLHVDCATV